MRILLVSPFPPPAGGIATWTVQYKKYCESNDVEVTYVNTALRGKRAISITSKRGLLSEVLRTIRIIRDFVRKFSENKINLVHLNTNCGKLGIFRDWLLCWLAKKRHACLIVHCRCNILDQLGTNRMTQYAFRKVVEWADKVLVLNSSSLAYVMNIDSSKPRILPNFIERSKVVSDRDIKQQLSEVVFVGHVQPSKGIYEIFHVASLYPKVNFRLVGPFSSEFGSRDMPKNVVLLGELKENSVLYYLDQADLFLFPTHTEGFANALLEAMARGLPVIATDVGANCDMLGPLGGIVVPVRNTEQLAVAFEAVLDPIVRRRMSRWNIDKVNASYTTENVMHELLAIYRETLQSIPVANA